MQKKRISDYGVHIGTLPCGQRNKITDVKGVLVGHSTIKAEKYRTGCTVIMPSAQNVYTHKLVAASFVHNGYGKPAGTLQVDELGTLDTVNRCEGEGVFARSVNPVVGECNDASMNTIVDRPVKKEHVFEAIERAAVDFEEGDVGAGTGTGCYGFKGGIGSASRVIELDGKEYTVGILVQSNYGATRDLMINGKHIDQSILDEINGAECDKGSIIVVLACDVPLTARQLKRAVKRCSVGIARLGSYIGHGSGEVFIGFSTANVIVPESEIMSIRCINENAIDRVFRSVGEATEEALLNSMDCASAASDLHGNKVHSLAEYLEKIK